MNDHYEDFLIREMNEPQNPEGELDVTESPGWGEEPNDQCKCGSPRYLHNGMEIRHEFSLDDCVHNPGSECALIPAEPGSPSNLPVPALAEPENIRARNSLCENTEGEARESAHEGAQGNLLDETVNSRGGQKLSDGKLRAPVNGNIDWPNYEPMQDDIGGNVIPDRIRANEYWFEQFDSHEWERGAESNAYANDEAEARRKEWNAD